jgi:peptidoglycan/LPS O-acetylase OafA/YrhL
MNMCKGRRRQRFETLDALRGLAALAVVSGHTQDLFGGSIFPLGYLAVDFFFMLSGFVLAYAYGQRIDGGLTVAHFMKARLIRFYPLYLIGLAIAVLAMLVERAQGLVYGKIVLYWTILELFFLPVPGVSAFPLFPMNSPVWSLFFELIANTCFGIFYRALTDITLAFLVALLAVLLIGTAFHFDTINIGLRWENVFGGLPRVGFSFFAGVALYRLWTKKSITVAAPLLFGIVAVFGALLSFRNFSFELPVALFATLICFPAIIYLGACCRAFGATARAAGVLGASSYALYVIHEPIYHCISLAYPELGKSAATIAPWGGIIFVSTCFGLALLLEHFLHRPASSFLSSMGFAGRATQVSNCEVVEKGG